MDVPPGVTAVGLTFLYLILMWASFIIVYDRYTGRSFQQDFPAVIIIRAFPWLLRLDPIVGRLTMTLYKGSKTSEQFHKYATEAFNILSDGSETLRDSRQLVKSSAQQVTQQINSFADNLQEEMDNFE